MRAAQNGREDTLGGVHVAGLEGHVSRSAFYLIHKYLDLEGLGPAPRG